MKTSLKYGNSILNINIPDDNYRDTLIPHDLEQVENPTKEVKRALAVPVESKSLQELVSGSKDVVILASDISRPSPSHILLPPLLDELNRGGIADRNIKVIFGLGIHRQQTEAEMLDLVGQEVYERVTCLNHDIDDCVDIGTTSRGTPVAINRKVAAADFLIATGNVEYHYYAGFSGGAKALAPGVSSRKTIKENHKHFLHQLARGGQIAGNPVREDIEEIGDMVGIDFIVNAILNSHKEIVKVVAGDVTEAHRAGTYIIEEMFSREIEKTADIVITSPGGYPKDIDLYQSHKAMENASLAVKKGGIIIITAACEDGPGEDNFAEALTGGYTPQELIDELKQKFVLGRHKASRIGAIHSESEIYLVSELSKTIKDKLFLKSFASVEDALAQALAVQGPEAKVLVLPYGISTLPLLAD